MHGVPLNVYATLENAVSQGGVKLPLFFNGKPGGLE